jgi:hypothetical protein
MAWRSLVGPSVAGEFRWLVGELHLSIAVARF